MIRYLTILLVFVVGCDLQFTEPSQKPNVQPSVSEVNAADCVHQYALGIAAAFETAANEYDAATDETAILDEFGDSQASERIKAFTPMIKAIDGVPGADEAARRKAKAELMRRFASEIRGAK